MDVLIVVDAMFTRTEIDDSLSGRGGSGVDGGTATVLPMLDALRCDRNTSPANEVLNADVGVDVHEGADGVKEQIFAAIDRRSIGGQTRLYSRSRRFRF